MSMNRREFLQKSGIGLCSLFVTSIEGKLTPADAGSGGMGTLFDATRCIGCRSCQLSCRERRLAENPALANINLEDNPKELSSNTWTILKLYQDPGNKSSYSFVKSQCMHCNDPACVTACPVGALEKTPAGPVIYHDSVCIGCRYCMAACPFNIPKYQWDKVFPLIQKCDFCANRQAQGQPPACAQACKNDALLYGKRSELLKMARERIEVQPAHYVQHIYGELELGGTAMLYLSAIPFQLLGLPEYGTKALPDLTWPWMSAVPGIFAGMAGLMTGIYFLRKRGKEKQVQSEETEA